jgi:hypothetical protein
MELLVSHSEVLPLAHGEGLGLFGNRTDVMSFIDDYNAPLKVKIDPFSYLLINYVIVWHEYDVCSLNPILLVVVGAHFPLFKDVPQLLDRERLLGSLYCSFCEIILQQFRFNTF